jgi:hypothetical protein
MASPVHVDRTIGEFMPEFRTEFERLQAQSLARFELNPVECGCVGIVCGRLEVSALQLLQTCIDTCSRSVYGCSRKAEST